jgi:hypothetical protein
MNAKRIPSALRPSLASSFVQFSLLRALGTMLGALMLGGCATSGEAPMTDGGGPMMHDAKPKSDGACGAVDQPCCAPPAECNTGAFCQTELNLCKDQHPPDQGHMCSGPSSCETQLCVYTQGLGDGGPVIPDGSPPPGCPATGCTAGCGSTSDCLGGWTCSMTLIGQGICVCTCNEEICDGQDNNCDGIIDNEPQTDKWCTSQMEGIPSKCVKGACACVDMCDEECVNLQNDPNNCGKCNKACTPTVEKCEKGECVCAYTVCSGNCVNTMGSDNANCGGCDTPCAYECTKGVCGPATIPITLSSIGDIMVDATNVYWYGINSSEAAEVDYCPLTGCTTPTVLAAATGFDESELALGQLALNSTTAYFPDGNGNIVECAKPPTGCGMAATTYSTSADSDGTTTVTADSSKVYWADEFAENVYDCADTLATCASPTLVQDLATTGTEPQGIAVSSTNVYWVGVLFDSTSFTETATVYSMLLGGGAISTLCTAADVDEVGQLIVAGTFVYFTDDDTTVYSCSTATTGAKATTYTTATSPVGLAADATNLYWGDNTTGSSSTGTPTGVLMTCALGATCASGTKITSGPFEIDGIAVTDTQIYWTATDSSFTPGVFYFKK